MAADDNAAQPAEDPEEQYDLRLTAFLRRLLRQHGRMETAALLGIDSRTLAASLSRGRLSERVRDALELALLSGEYPAAARLEQRVDSLAQEMRGALEDLRGAVARESERREELEERVAELVQQLETALGAADGSGELRAGDVVNGLGAQQCAEVVHGGPMAGRVSPPRRYPDLVTREPADGDEEVYGAAYPLISEWRGLWAGHPPQGKGLAWVSTRERILELEIAMLDQHGLTLPPETYPLGGLDRREQTSWRERALRRFRRKRASLEMLHWARRWLTLGLWRR